MSKNLLNTDGSVTNYWWDCPSCGETKISSVLHDEEGNIIGATMCCPQCSYVIKGDENTYVDETVYEIPPQWVSLLEKPRWKCQQCGALNEKPSDQELQNLTTDDLYCTNCETWQCDIPGTPNYDPNAVLKRHQKVEKKSRWENPISPIELTEDQAKYQVKYQAKYQNSDHKNLFKFKKTNKLILLILTTGISLTGLFFNDGLKLRKTEGLISDPLAVVNVDISQYQIVQKQGWSPDNSASDYIAEYDLVST